MRKTEYDHDYAIRIGGVLRRIREREKLTQTELADRIGTGQSAVSETETGVTTPTLWFLRRYIEDGLGYKLRIVMEKKYEA